MVGRGASSSPGGIGPRLRQAVADTQPPARAWSLIVTVFGDAIVPRGGSVWLGTLHEIMVHLGIEQGGVRTALSRLAADGWVERERQGRNSYYRLTERARAASEGAAARIYGIPDDDWGGRWRLVVLDEAPATERARRRDSLSGLGFGQLTPQLLIAPERAGEPSLESVGGGSGDLAWLTCLPTNATQDRRIARAAWPLDALAQSYRGLVERLEPFVADVAPNAGALEGLDALALRIWTVHELRRITLRDPGLPAAVLPGTWPGLQARMLAGRIWRATLGASEAWLDRNGRASDGPLPPARPEPGRFRSEA